MRVSDSATEGRTGGKSTWLFDTVQPSKLTILGDSLFPGLDTGGRQSVRLECLLDSIVQSF